MTWRVASQSRCRGAAPCDSSACRSPPSRFRAAWPHPRGRPIAGRTPNSLNSSATARGQLTAATQGKCAPAPPTTERAVFNGYARQGRSGAAGILRTSRCSAASPARNAGGTARSTSARVRGSGADHVAVGRTRRAAASSAASRGRSASRTARGITACAPTAGMSAAPGVASPARRARKGSAANLARQSAGRRGSAARRGRSARSAWTPSRAALSSTTRSAASAARRTANAVGGAGATRSRSGGSAVTASCAPKASVASISTPRFQGGSAWCAASDLGPEIGF